MKFLIRAKKHQRYLYLSVFIIILFFAGSSLTTPKITSVTENLIEHIVQDNLKSKENIIAFEFNQLNQFLEDSEKMINSSSASSIPNLKSKLLFNSDLSVSNPNVSNSFVCFLDKKLNKDICFSKKNNTVYRHEIISWINTFKKNTKEVFLDSVVKSQGGVFNRKIVAKKLVNGTIAIIGYDIDLLHFWKYYSEVYKGEGGYTVVTNAKGICVLHPETRYIGNPLPNFFKTFSITKVLKNSENINSYYQPDDKNILREKAISTFLGIEVLRYYDAVKIGRNSLVVIVSFPVDIYLKESIVSIKKYFSWMTVFAFCAFMLLLAVSRTQLKKEFAENLIIVNEKEDLMRVNEKFQHENAVLQLSQLKKKMNPHFLFNSLNSLHVLIGSKPEVSQQFVLKLADVYRYLLEEREQHLVTVKKELDFLKQYIFLQEIRFSSSLNVSISCECEAKILLKKIPFLSLETLVENAIKHNEITKQKPLYISIVIHETEIIVSNNYAPRKNKDQSSHHIGLDYLRNNYEYYQVDTFRTVIDDGAFKCYLPLLS
ncbi:sensor histidine kinase [Flavobacterium aquicola]|uniref:Histidine kinase n=1 Tax=Flavobacterium aquicola TaxID=1682742 RepID=A0A3E0EU54_9FLAO|nr:sensor histidine kinase [Flavobacterium aquicola]REH01755.1 histidine kinase [Flavobacterium aquicola]